MSYRIPFLKLEWSMPKAFHIQPYREFYVWRLGRRAIETPAGCAVFWSLGPLRINLYSFGYWKARQDFFKSFTMGSTPAA